MMMPFTVMTQKSRCIGVGLLGMALSLVVLGGPVTHSAASLLPIADPGSDAAVGVVGEVTDVGPLVTYHRESFSRQASSRRPAKFPSDTSCHDQPSAASLRAAILSQKKLIYGNVGPARSFGSLSSYSPCWGVGNLAPVNVGPNAPANEHWQGSEIIEHFVRHQWRLVTYGTALGFVYCRPGSHDPTQWKYYVPRAVVCS